MLDRYHPYRTPAGWLLLLMLLASQADAQTQLDRQAREELSTTLASALLLTDSEAVTFGVLSFDPNRFLPGLDEGFASEESLSRRRGVKVFNLPWRFNFSAEEQRLQHKLKVRLSYLELDRNIDFGPEREDTTQDGTQTRVFALYGGYKTSFDWTSKWRLEAETGLHLQRYDNQYDYNNSLSQAAAGDVDGLLFNNSATALIAGVKGSLVYADEVFAKPWQWRATYSYYAGETVATSDQLPAAEPETWSLANELAIKFPLPQVFARDNRLRLAAERIDLGGDAQRTLATSHYYRFSLGWLVKTGDLDWFSNIGAAIALNIGSALSGGTLQLLYNETF